MHLSALEHVSFFTAVTSSNRNMLTAIFRWIVFFFFFDWFVKMSSDKLIVCVTVVLLSYLIQAMRVLNIFCFAFLFHCTKMYYK